MAVSWVLFTFVQGRNIGSEGIGCGLPSYGLPGTPFKIASQMRRLSSLMGSRRRRASLGDFLYSFSSWIRRLVVDAEGAADAEDDDAHGDDDGIAIAYISFV